MAHNTRPLKRAQDGVAPQYYNPTTDEYEVLLGQDGAARAILYGPNGQPITNESPLEVRVRQLETLLGALDAAKETNPDAASATLLALIRGLMSAAAKETTLEAIKSTDGIKKIADAVTVSGLGNLATETKLEAVRTLVEGLKSELATIKANQLSGDQKVQLSGTKVVESAPVTGIKTVTSTVAEVFAGFSRKANRSKLIIRNLHPAVAIRIGGSGITDTIGQSVEPGASVEIDFSPSTAVPIYAVSTAGNVSVGVLEV
jgi:hypothetical protein